jgi:hypothetical protein
MLDLVKLVACFCWFLAWLIFDPEDGGDMLQM